MKGEGEKLKPSEARAGVRARKPARVRARRVHKLPTRTERAEGEDIDAHRINRVRVRDFLQSCRVVLPFVVVSRRVARGMVFRLRRARAACVDVQKAGPSAETNGTRLYKQLPGRQISGLRSCRGVEQ